MPIATEVFYIRRLPDKIPQDMGINITKEIHNQFIETLNRAAWMDIDSREASLEKAKAMKFLFGYSDEFDKRILQRSEFSRDGLTFLYRATYSPIF